MQGDFNGPRAPTQSNPHAHNHTNMHAHIRSSILTHIIYAGEKYINICIKKTVQGPQCNKIPLVLESVWVVIFLTPSAKLSLSLPSTKYLFVNYEKYSHSLMGFEALDYISVHKKSSHPPTPQLSLKVCSAVRNRLRRATRC